MNKRTLPPPRAQGQAQRDATELLQTLATVESRFAVGGPDALPPARWPA